MYLIKSYQYIATDNENGDLPGFEGQKILGTHKFTSKDVAGPITFRVTRGDYSKLLEIVVQNLELAAVSVS